MNFILILVLGCLSAFGPMAIDFYLPSFNDIATDFHTDVASVQLSLASYFIGLSLGQLICGPFTDRVGRRSSLIAGVILFILASVGCAIAQSLNQLIVMRFIQALGGCAGMVVPRAFVRDYFDVLQSARIFSRLALVSGITPMIAPTLGTLITSFVSWHYIFVFIALFACIILFLVIRVLPESLPPEKRIKTNIQQAFAKYMQLFANKSFMKYTIIASLSISAMFIYIVSSPIILMQHFQVTREYYGFVFGISALCFVIVAQFNAYWITRYGVERVFSIGVLVHILGAVLLLLASLFRLPLQVFIVSLGIFVGSLGMVMPNSSACAMENVPFAGFASALLGSLNFAISALMVYFVSSMNFNTPLSLSCIMLACALLSMCIKLKL